MTQKELHSLFEYNKAGFLIWKVQPHRRGDLIGQRAGWTRPLPSPRRHIQIGKQVFYEHRLVYLFHFGKLPRIIDHKNNNPLDNRIENLREATGSQNLANQKISKRNKTGVRGVYFCKTHKKWTARIAFNKQVQATRRFLTFEEAVAERKRMEKIYFKQFRYGGAPCS